MKKTTIIVLLSMVLAIMLYSNCFARGVKVQKGTLVYETAEDIESSNPCGAFNPDSIVDAYYSDTVNIKGKEYILTIGKELKEGEAVYTKGYAESSAFFPIYSDIRTLSELSPHEIRSLMYAAGKSIHDETGIYAFTGEDKLISNGYLDIQVSDHCAVVSFRDKDEDILFKTEFLFTMNEYMAGEYRTLYVEQNGKGVFGSYEPIQDTAATEKMLGVSFSGFTYEE